MVWMMSRKPFSYRSRALKAGSPFSARGREAKLLEGAGRARRILPDELAKLRAEGHIPSADPTPEPEPQPEPQVEQQAAMDAQSEPVPAADDDDDEEETDDLDELRGRATALGIEVNPRWRAKRLRKEIADATAIDDEDE